MTNDSARQQNNKVRFKGLHQLTPDLAEEHNLPIQIGI